MNQRNNQRGNNAGSSSIPNPSENQIINEEKFEELKKLIGEQESRIQALQTSAFQLANFYFVFQGVVFSAISNSPSLICRDSWYVFIPSLIAAILNFFALFSIGFKYIRAMNIHDRTWSEYHRAARILLPGTRDRDHTSELKFTGSFTPSRSVRNTSTRHINDNVNHSSNDFDEDDRFWQNWVDPFSEVRRYVLLGVCMFLFVAFTAVTLSGPWAVVCKHQNPRLEANQGSDCLELCNGSKCLSFCHRP